jgi:hypothetical protein
MEEVLRARRASGKKREIMNYSVKVTIKFDQASEQCHGFVRRIFGLVKLKHLIPLISDLDLEANPRDSRVSKVTNDILESLEKTPDTFAYKSKGILVAASEYRALERNRYELIFVNPQIEGILDGGHNTLAVGLHILELALGEEFHATSKSIKLWDDFKTVWDSSAQKIKDYRDSLDPEDESFNTLIPVELLLPLDSQDPIYVESFNRALLEICAARNNNAQLKTEAKANAQGYFEALKNVLPAEISSRVEWRPNDGGEIKTPDVVSLAWIPLSFYSGEFTDEDGKIVDAPSMPQIYSTKGDCVTRFERLMSSHEVSEVSGGNFKRDLKNSQVLSAFKIAGQMPALFDLIYEAFPDAYNSQEGKFGKITAVKKMNGGKIKVSKYTRKAIAWKYPEGYVVPVVAGLRAIMEKDESGNLNWKVADPALFVKKHLNQVVASYKGVIELVDYDPQKVGKASAAYETAFNAFETAFYKSAAK